MSPTTIASIPNEDLARIFDHLPAKLRHSTLLSAALVCRRWSGAAQRELFGALQLESKQRADAWLASDVRRSFRVREVHLQESGKATELLEACGGLTSLELECRGIEFAHLQQPSLAGLRSLSLWFPEDLTPTAGAAPLPFALTSLRLWLDGSVAPTLLPSLLLPSLSSLHLVHFGRSPKSAQGLLSLLASPSGNPLRNVRHLTLSGSGTTPLFLTLLTLLPGLTSLALRDEFFAADYMEPESAFDLLAEALGSSVTLEEISVGEVESGKGDFREVFRGLEGTVGRWEMRRLNRVVVRGSGAKGALEEGGAGRGLVEECAVRGIRVQVEDGIF